jgi:hypothetical protein
VVDFGLRMIGTILSSSMSSSARAVFFGRLPGIFLLMKWITCSTTGGGRSSPADAGLLRGDLLQHVVGEALRLVADAHHGRARRVDGLRIGGVQEEHRRRLAGLNFLPILRSRLRMFIDTSPKSIFTGQGVAHLWQTVQWSATSLNSSQCLIDTPRRVCSSYRKASTSSEVEDLVARAVQQVGARHVGRAHRLALAAAQAVLDRIGDRADVALLHDQRLVPIRPKLGV